MSCEVTRSDFIEHGSAFGLASVKLETRMGLPKVDLAYENLFHLKSTQFTAKQASR